MGDPPCWAHLVDDARDPGRTDDPPIGLRRAYDPPGPDDGHRVLVDRLWPRGVSRDALALDDWLPDLAPSDALRRWFGHDPARWEEFRARYRDELVEHAPAVDRLADRAAAERLTLVFGARDEARNNAAVLREVLEERRAHPFTPPPAPRARPADTPGDR